MPSRSSFPLLLFNLQLFSPRSLLSFLLSSQLSAFPSSPPNSFPSVPFNFTFHHSRLPSSSLFFMPRLPLSFVLYISTICHCFPLILSFCIFSIPSPSFSPYDSLKEEITLRHIAGGAGDSCLMSTPGCSATCCPIKAGLSHNMFENEAAEQELRSQCFENVNRLVSDFFYCIFSLCLIVILIIQRALIWINPSPICLVSRTVDPSHCGLNAGAEPERFWWAVSLVKSFEKEADRQMEVDGEREGSGPAEAAARLKARRKALGNTQEIAVVDPPLHHAQLWGFCGDLLNAP